MGLKTYFAINFTMLDASWGIGKSILEVQGEKETSEYGKGFTVTNLK